MPIPTDTQNKERSKKFRKKMIYSDTSISPNSIPELKDDEVADIPEKEIRGNEERA